MKVYALNRKQDTGERCYMGNLGLLPTEMYHGYAFRGREGDEGWDQSFGYGDTDYRPLHVIKNIYEISKILQPHLSFLVHEDIKVQMEKMPHISFEKVIFDKLYNVPLQYEMDDYGPDKPGTTTLKDFGKFSRKVTGIDGYPSEIIGDYYELLCSTYYHEDFESDFAGGIRIYRSHFKDESIIKEINTGDPFGWSDEPLVVEISRELLDEYPIMYVLGWSVHIMDERAFSILEPYLDPRYYHYSYAEIDI